MTRQNSWSALWKRCEAESPGRQPSQPIKSSSDSRTEISSSTTNTIDVASDMETDPNS